MRFFEKFNKELDTKLPQRSDSGSAGYDFYSNKEFVIEPKQSVLIPTNVRVHMNKNDVLLLFVRSSTGIKKHIVLSNNTGVIDSTYEGEIHCALYNYGTEPQTIKMNDRLMQGVFVKYGITDDDTPKNNRRVGGIGSSGC